MNRQEKELLVSQLSEKLKNSNASFLISVKGLTVSDLQILRKELYQKGSLKIAKVRLMKLAVKGVPGAEEYNDHLKEQLAIVFANEEPTSVAKILYDFSKTNEKLNFVGGVFESKFLEKDKVKFIATLPSRDVLLSQLLGMLNSPIVGLVSVLNNILVKPVLVLKQIGENKN
jgi:large subunit ribosomal protein L10